MSVVQKVSDIARPIVEGLGIELIEAEYVKEGSKWILRLYIDKKGGVGLDDCEVVSRAVEPALDVEDPIREPYVFEVSSPGLERPLKTDRDFERYEGEAVEVGLYAPREGVKQFTGTLKGKQDGVITIFCGDEEVHFTEKEVAVVKRTIIW